MGGDAISGPISDRGACPHRKRTERVVPIKQAQRRFVTESNESSITTGRRQTKDLRTRRNCPLPDCPQNADMGKQNGRQKLFSLSLSKGSLMM